MTKRERAAEMRAQGITYREIGETVGVSLRTAFRWLNPEYDARDRASAQAYKDRNREANRARDRAYSMRLDVRGRCASCDGPMGIGVSGDGVCDPCRSTAAREREQRFVDLYNDGLPLREIAVQLDTTVNALSMLMNRVRKQGRIGYRHAGWAERVAA